MSVIKFDHYNLCASRELLESLRLFYTEEVLFEISRVNMQCNLVKEAAGLGHGMSNRFKGLLV